MALTFTQKPAPAGSKSKAKAVTEVVQLSETQEKVNEYVALAKMLEDMEVSKIEKRMEVLKKELHSIANEAPLDDTVRLKGTIGEVIFSPAKTDTVVVDKDAMMLTLGDSLFKEIAKVGITDLRKYLSAAEVDSFTEKKYGSRSLKGFTVAE